MIFDPSWWLQLALDIVYIAAAVLVASWMGIFLSTTLLYVGVQRSEELFLKHFKVT